MLLLWWWWLLLFGCCCCCCLAVTILCARAWILLPRPVSSVLWCRTTHFQPSQTLSTTAWHENQSNFSVCPGKECTWASRIVQMERIYCGTLDWFCPESPNSHFEFNWFNWFNTESNRPRTNPTLSACSYIADWGGQAKPQFSNYMSFLGLYWFEFAVLGVRSDFRFLAESLKKKTWEFRQSQETWELHEKARAEQRRAGSMRRDLDELSVVLLFADHVLFWHLETRRWRWEVRFKLVSFVLSQMLWRSMVFFFWCCVMCFCTPVPVYWLKCSIIVINSKTLNQKKSFALRFTQMSRPLPKIASIVLISSLLLLNHKHLPCCQHECIGRKFNDFHQQYGQLIAESTNHNSFFFNVHFKTKARHKLNKTHQKKNILWFHCFISYQFTQNQAKTLYKKKKRQNPTTKLPNRKKLVQWQAYGVKKLILRQVASSSTIHKRNKLESHPSSSSACF